MDQVPGDYLAWFGFMVFNATFNNISAQFYWWRKQEYPEKTSPVASH
jgi:hypothetical protein